MPSMHACISCMHVKHACHACTSCMHVMHAWHACMSCMRVMHVCHAWGLHMGTPHGDPTWGTHMPTCLNAHVPSLMPMFPASCPCSSPHAHMPNCPHMWAPFLCVSWGNSFFNCPQCFIFYLSLIITADGSASDGSGFDQQMEI